MCRWVRSRKARGKNKRKRGRIRGREWKQASLNRRKIMVAGSGGGWWLVVGGCCAMNFSGYIDCVCRVNPRRLLVCRPWLPVYRHEDNPKKSKPDRARTEAGGKRSRKRINRGKQEEETWPEGIAITGMRRKSSPVVCTNEMRLPAHVG